MLNLKVMVHALMLVFAGASFFNVRAYFVGAGHDDYAAIALGAALGGALVIVASMLTHTDREADPDGYRVVLRVGVGLGLVSGYLQAAEYAGHLPLLPSVLLGFAIPLLGEVGLAFAYSAYSKARERERFRSVSLTIESAAAAVLDDAIQGFDPAPIRKHVDRTLTGLLRLAVDNASVKAGAYYARAEPPQLTQDTARNTEGNTEVYTDAPVECVTTPIVHTKGNTSDQLQEARRQKQEQRREQLIHTVKEHGPHTQITVLADLLGVGRKTVYSDLEALEEAGVIHRNGNGIEVLK